MNRLRIPVFQAVVLVFLQLEPLESSRVAFLKAIEHQLFVRSLVNRRTAFSYPIEFSADGFRMAIELRAGKTSTEKVTKSIRDETFAMLKQEEFLRVVIARFRAEGFYNWEGIRYFLFEYNLDLQNRAKTDRPKIFWPEFNEMKDDFVSVEHIFPRQARHDYWGKLFKGILSETKSSTPRIIRQPVAIVKTQRIRACPTNRFRRRLREIAIRLSGTAMVAMQRTKLQRKRSGRRTQYLNEASGCFASWNVDGNSRSEMSIRKGPCLASTL